MYGLVTEGEPFSVFARRENAGTGGLVIRFECKEGMGILGIRKSGRTDPAPSAAYEEEEIEPASLRAGRFVHVLPSGQRQSYALSRISAEVTNRMPYDRWIALKPHTEYGFRYLVAPDSDLDGTVASIRVGPATLPPSSTPEPAASPVRQQHAAQQHAAQQSAGLEQTPLPASRSADTPEPVPRFELPPAREPTGPVPSSPIPSSPIPSLSSPSAEPPAPLPVSTGPMPTPHPGATGHGAPRSGVREVQRDRAPASLPPTQTPMAPNIAENALRMMPKEVAIDHLKAEMQKVHVLQQRIAELEDTLRRSRMRERDLLELLSKWDP